MLPVILPGKITVFIFDNSSAHASLAPNALTVTKMNVGPGGKRPSMHDTVIPQSNPYGFAGQTQSMVFPTDLPKDHEYAKHAGQSKGMRVILEEHGFIIRTGQTAINVQNHQKIIGECKVCKQKKAEKPHLESLTPDKPRGVDKEEANETEEDEHNADCCTKQILSLQEDFKGEKSLLKKVCATLTCLWHLIDSHR